MRTAFSNMAAKTGSRSPGELLITCSTSDVAVCCSSNSLRSVVRWRSSLSSRAFSIAMTACAAKLVTSAICFSVKGTNLLPGHDKRTYEFILLQHGNDKGGAYPAKFDGCNNGR